MNERILELAKQAGMIIGDTSKFDMAAVMPKEVKFAELIVRECAELVDGRTFLYAGNTIREHFGVEE
jgi:hypothetical protein